MPDFDLANSEFDRQTDILESLLLIINLSASGSLRQSHNIAVSAPAGGQNTMAACVIVLLAAHFEEYIRQQVQEYASALIQNYDELDPKLKSSLRDTYWRIGSKKLEQIRPKTVQAWDVSAERMLRQLLEFPIANKKEHFLASVICEHERNMKWDVITELLARVGVKSLGQELSSYKKIREYFGNPEKADLTNEIQEKFEEFYSIRNRLVHSISQNSGFGSGIISEWTNFLRIFNTSLAECLSGKFQIVENSIQRALVQRQI